MDNYIKYKTNYINNNIFLEDTFVEFNQKFSKLTDIELSELFWLWENTKYKSSNKSLYIDEIIIKLGVDSGNNIIIVDRLSASVYNKYELIFREIRNRWLSNFI